MNAHSCFWLKLGLAVDKPIGEVSVQIELYTPSGKGERKVTVKGQFEFPYNCIEMYNIYSSGYTICLNCYHVNLLT